MVRRSAWTAGLLAGVLAFAAMGRPGAAQLAGFDATAAEEEGYWYSRYSLGNLVMRSGMGEHFMPEMDMVQMMVRMADADPSDGDTAMPPVNAALLKAVYASGDPHFTQQMVVEDFATQRWDPASFDQTITSRAMGWTIIKEVEWAKQFHVDEHFGTPADDFGAQWRFVGLVLTAEAKMQAQYALQMLKNGQGFVADSDGTVDWGGQWVMLEALSDLGSTLDMDAVPHSHMNRYMDAGGAGMFLDAADMLFDALASRHAEDVEELSLAIQALTWYAATTADAGRQATALVRLERYGDRLLSATGDNASDAARIIRGLVEAHRVRQDDQYLAAAARTFAALAAEYDADHGIFASQNRYTIDDVATILGAVNSIKLFGGASVDQDRVEEIFTGFFEHVINLSGLQLAAPPKSVAKDLFEQDEPDIYYAYPGMPMPPMAGGEFGRAPVFAAEVTWDGTQWRVTNERFDTAGAMHAANEFIWFHNDEVNGFPVVEIATAVEEATGSLATPPERFRLAPNYPNPFNPATTLSYSLPRDAHVTLDVFNAKGQRVRTLADGNQRAGSHRLGWNGRGNDGARVASGIYFYRIQAQGGVGAGAFTETRKMTLMQ